MENKNKNKKRFLKLSLFLLLILVMSFIVSAQNSNSAAEGLVLVNPNTLRVLSLEGIQSLTPSVCINAMNVVDYDIISYLFIKYFSKDSPTNIYSTKYCSFHQLDNNVDKDYNSWTSYIKDFNGDCERFFDGDYNIETSIRTEFTNPEYTDDRSIQNSYYLISSFISNTIDNENLENLIVEDSRLLSLLYSGWIDKIEDFGEHESDDISFSKQEHEFLQIYALNSYDIEASKSIFDSGMIKSKILSSDIFFKYFKKHANLSNDEFIILAENLDINSLTSDLNSQISIPAELDLFTYYYSYYNQFEKILYPVSNLSLIIYNDKSDKLILADSNSLTDLSFSEDNSGTINKENILNDINKVNSNFRIELETFNDSNFYPLPSLNYDENKESMIALFNFTNNLMEISSKDNEKGLNFKNLELGLFIYFNDYLNHNINLRFLSENGEEDIAFLINSNILIIDNSEELAPLNDEVSKDFLNKHILIIQKELSKTNKEFTILSIYKDKVITISSGDLSFTTYNDLRYSLSIQDSTMVYVQQTDSISGALKANIQQGSDSNIVIEGNPTIDIDLENEDNSKTEIKNDKFKQESNSEYNNAVDEIEELQKEINEKCVTWITECHDLVYDRETLKINLAYKMVWISEEEYDSLTNPTTEEDEADRLDFGRKVFRKTLSIVTTITPDQNLPDEIKEKFTQLGKFQKEINRLTFKAEKNDENAKILADLIIERDNLITELEKDNYRNQVWFKPQKFLTFESYWLSLGTKTVTSEQETETSEQETETSEQETETSEQETETSEQENVINEEVKTTFSISSDYSLEVYKITIKSMLHILISLDLELSHSEHSLKSKVLLLGNNIMLLLVEFETKPSKLDLKEIEKLKEETTNLIKEFEDLNDKSKIGETYEMFLGVANNAITTLELGTSKAIDEQNKKGSKVEEVEDQNVNENNYEETLQVLILNQLIQLKTLKSKDQPDLTYDYSYSLDKIIKDSEKLIDDMKDEKLTDAELLQNLNFLLIHLISSNEHMQKGITSYKLDLNNFLVEQKKLLELLKKFKILITEKLEQESSETNTGVPDDDVESSDIEVEDADDEEQDTPEVDILIINWDEEAKKKIVLDPGHGGLNPGATTIYLGKKYKESEMNLNFAKLLRTALEPDYEVILTREIDKDLLNGNDFNKDGLIDRYDDTYERVLFANEHEADIYLPLHHDSRAEDNNEMKSDIYVGCFCNLDDRGNGDKDICRYQPSYHENYISYYNPAENYDYKNYLDKSVLLANNIFRSLNNYQPRKMDFIKCMDANYLVGYTPKNSEAKYNPQMPTVLIELGFMSSNSDMILLTHKDFQNEMVDVIVKSINNYFEEEETFEFIRARGDLAQINYEEAIDIDVPVYLQSDYSSTGQEFFSLLERIGPKV